MKPQVSFLVLTVGAALFVGGCSKADSTGGPAETVQGPVLAVKGAITDSASSGLQPVPGATLALGDPHTGLAIYTANCQSCHMAGGTGGVGPKLIGERGRKDYAQAIAWIKNPKAPMPKLYPAPLSESDVSDVAAYVESL